MGFADRVARFEDSSVAAGHLRSLVASRRLPGFLSPFDRLLLRAGGRLARLFPRVVVPLAQLRLRQLVGHLVVGSDTTRLRRHLTQRQHEGFGANVNLLGEAVLGAREAERRYRQTLRLLDEPGVDYVSVKLSALVPQLNYWDYDTCMHKVTARLRSVLQHADATRPQTFINLDMEEYHDLELTLAAFMSVLDEPELRHVDAGIVLQAYLPDSFEALRSLVAWAQDRDERARGDRPTGEIKIRLVKGANLAMERVEAAVHRWPQAPYETKAETDANYKRCIDWLLTRERTRAVRVGIASHNLFDVAWSRMLAERRQVIDRVEFEMLEGMAPTHARLLAESGDRPLLYTPVAAGADFDVAISYLFRRLEENAADDNFMRHLFSLEPDSASFIAQADKFRAAVADRGTVSSAPRRSQHRDRPPDRVRPETPFDNEPDSDPSLPAVRAWARQTACRDLSSRSVPVIETIQAVDDRVEHSRLAGEAWAATSSSERQRILYDVAHELACRRGDLIAAMMTEGRKTFPEADPEVSEAIDFARWYGDRALDLQTTEAATFVPIGVVTVAPPWNFPVAIPTGGAAAALAAGNTVLLKPAPETPKCAAIIAECCWAAGVPANVVQLVHTRDDEAGQRLITHPDVGAVVLTGARETADLFRLWRPDLRLYAETSGKNAMIITPSADIDLAVADLVQSAFGHSGQKCSAASIAICIGSVYDSSRFRRQLRDAVTSLHVSAPIDLATDTGPLISRPEGKLRRALTRLEPTESWLVEPAPVASDIWRPGVRLGVEPGSWFHQTECFGPVLGLIEARTLGDAVAIQNSTPFGLTGGIHSLDAAEVDRWTDRVEVGNAYINRAITGAIVRRQPFGGWKHSSVGPGAKTGGPNYVASLGDWQPAEEPRDERWLSAAMESDAEAWAEEFGVEHDETGLFCEANVFRYRPISAIGLRVEDASMEVEVQRVRHAADCCGVPVIESHVSDESPQSFADRLGTLGIDRVRVVGAVEPAIRGASNRLNVHLCADPVTRDGRIELRHYVREQAISSTLHRYGNLMSSRKSP